MQFLSYKKKHRFSTDIATIPYVSFSDSAIAAAAAVHGAIAVPAAAAAPQHQHHLHYDHAFNSAFASLRRRRHHAVHRVFTEGLLISGTSYLHKRAAANRGGLNGGAGGVGPPPMMKWGGGKSEKGGQI